MAARNQQKLKLIHLLRLLESETDSQWGLTMPQIIEGLAEQGISAERKSIYRDLEALSDAGYEIRKLPTRPVQYALVRNGLDLDDVMLLIDAVQSSPFLTERKSNQLVRSLKGLVSTKEQRRLDKRVHVQGRIRNQSDSVFHNVDIIHEAIKDKHKVEFLYFSYGTDLARHARHEGKRYKLTPIKVVYSEGNYYLVAHEDQTGQIRTYRIDRMELLQTSAERATRDAAIANYGLDDFAYHSFSMFQGEPVIVTLKVQAPLMDAIVDRFGDQMEVVRSTKNAAEIRVPVQVSVQFFGWLAGLDGGVVIKSPQRVARSYKAWLLERAKAE